MRKLKKLGLVRARFSKLGSGSKILGSFHPYFGHNARPDGVQDKFGEPVLSELVPALSLDLTRLWITFTLAKL